MEALQDYVSKWQIIQVVGAAGITFIGGGLFWWYAQTKINDANRSIEKLATEQKVLQQKKDALSGEITKPRNEVAISELISIRIGGMSTGYPRHWFKGGKTFSPIAMGQPSGKVVEPFKIKVDSTNRILISAQFLDLVSGEVSILTDNEWEINKNNWSRRNYDDSGVEVMDRDGIAKIQFDYVDNNTVLITGLFRLSKVVIEAHVDYVRMHQPEHITTEKAREISNSIPNLFRYPADNHFGERVKK
jgi:hypothetical protein